MGMQNQSKSHEHGFGGCERLRGHYQTIGSVLQRLERNGLGVIGSIMLVHQTVASAHEFRESVVFVPVEVLESFFDDLLDPQVTEEKLFISVQPWAGRLVVNAVSLLGLGGSLLAALYVSSLGLSLILAFMLMVVLSLPFAAMLYVSVGGAARRLRFAQIVSKEVVRRRGGTGSQGVLRDATLRLREALSPQPAQPSARTTSQLVH
jgi:hypothetical protein